MSRDACQWWLVVKWNVVCELRACLFRWNQALWMVFALNFRRLVKVALSDFEKVEKNAIVGVDEAKQHLCEVALGVVCEVELVVKGSQECVECWGDLST